MSNFINISSLTVGYEKPVLKDISLSSESKQLIGVFGRNGEGKSTLLKTLSGLLPPISGQFICDGIDIMSLSEKERSKLLSIVSTHKIQIGGIKVKDYVALGRYPYTNWLGINKLLDNKEIEKAISLCNLNDLSDRNYEELSDGEKQKVNIARAIAQNTSIIILDEPTVHLDLINKIEVLKILKKLVVDHSKTIIISTHQIEFALQVCDEIWLINDGNIQAFSTSEIINSEKFLSLFKSKDISFDRTNLTFKLK